MSSISTEESSQSYDDRIRGMMPEEESSINIEDAIIDLLRGKDPGRTIKKTLLRIGANMIERQVEYAVGQVTERIKDRIRSWKIKNKVRAELPGKTEAALIASIMTDSNVGEFMVTIRKSEVELKRQPTSGSVSFTWNDVEYQVYREMPDGMSGNKNVISMNPTYWISCDGNRKDLLELLEHVIEQRDQSRVEIHRLDTYGRWNSQEVTEGMKMEHLVFAKGIKEKVTSDLESFFDREDEYKKHGIPWRRGYLLEGPHGTGKTSMVRALAAKYGLSIYEVDVSNEEIDDGTLKNAVDDLGRGDALLLEDIDHALGEGGVTVGGLINAIDGISIQQGRLLFMTTNNADQLPAKLIRHGRVDERFHIGLATGGQVRRLFKKFFPDAPKNITDHFFAKVPPDRYSPAEIQAHLFQADTPQEAIDKAHKIERISDNFYE